jgi:hypothetical protein
MGLDMYLSGRKYMRPDYEATGTERKEDGFRVDEVKLDLAYWRKHPDLHGYIVRTYGGGEDTCQEIHLDADALRAIQQAVEQEQLTVTTGFFFGSSGEHWNKGEGKQKTLLALATAVKWLEAQDPDKDHRNVYYQASW